MLNRKQTCVNCHFFVKEARSLPSRQPVSLDVSAHERKKASEGDFSWVKDVWTLACHFTVWDEGYDFDQSRRKQIIVESNRRNFCFFWRHRPGMLLPAAKALQEREAQAHKASRDRRLTIVGLWVAVGGLVINAWLKVAEAVHWWPFK
jgi:hypothetical protein